MLENEFFPTPNATIGEMVSFANYKSGNDGSVLDPNGGSGAILDYLKEFNTNRFNNSDIRKFYALEINQDLKYTLQGKGYKVLGFDFLEYDEPMTFNWIFMNPPFSNGVDHVLKAYTHLKDGGTLVALLNAQTIKNPHTKNKQNLIHLLCKSFNEQSKDGWSINYSEDNLTDTLEHLEKQNRIKWLGRCFTHAERPTTVEVVMIKITKPKKLVTINFEEIKFDLDAELGQQQFNPNALVSRDIVRDLVARYNAVRKIVIERYETQAKLDFYLQGISDSVYGTFDRNGRQDKTATCLDNETDLNTQLAYLKSRFWNTVFIKTEIGNKATSNFRKKFEEFTVQQSTIAFTEENVKEVLYLFIANMGSMMRDCVIEVFDKATAYHEKNQIHNEGWKTNKSWKLNKRIIVPNGVTFDGRWSDDGSFSINYYQSDFLNDLDRVMNFLSGIKPDKDNRYNGSTYSTISDFCNNYQKYGKHYSDTFENEHFKFKIFKKGTLHIDFKDLKVLEQINRIAAEGKNWIGQGC